MPTVVCHFGWPPKEVLVKGARELLSQQKQPLVPLCAFTLFSTPGHCSSDMIGQ